MRFPRHQRPAHGCGYKDTPAELTPETSRTFSDLGLQCESSGLRPTLKTMQCPRAIRRPAKEVCQAALKVNYRVVGLFWVHALRCILPRRDRVAQAKQRKYVLVADRRDLPPRQGDTMQYVVSSRSCCGKRSRGRLTRASVRPFCSRHCRTVIWHMICHICLHASRGSCSVVGALSFGSKDVSRLLEPLNFTSQFVACTRCVLLVCDADRETQRHVGYISQSNGKGSCPLAGWSISTKCRGHAVFGQL